VAALCVRRESFVGIARGSVWWYSFFAIFAFFCGQSLLPREGAEGAESLNSERSDQAGRRWEFESGWLEI